MNYIHRDLLNHAEAYMVMTYICDQCGAEERVWNSRDGVVPFVIQCVRCDGYKVHRNFNQDIFDPKYYEKLLVGDRYFKKATIKEHKEKVNKRINKLIESAKESEKENIRGLKNTLYKTFVEGETIIKTFNGHAEEISYILNNQ